MASPSASSPTNCDDPVRGRVLGSVSDLIVFLPDNAERVLHHLMALDGQIEKDYLYENGFIRMHYYVC